MINFFNSLSTAEIIFINCEIPIENRLLNEGDGYSIALKILDSSRIMIAAQCVGIAKGSLHAAINYSKQRQTFNKPISQHPSIAFTLADMATDLHASRLMTWQAARFHDQHSLPLPFLIKRAVLSVVLFFSLFFQAHFYYHLYNQILLATLLTRNHFLFHFPF